MMLHKSRCHGPTAREILYSPPTQKNNNPAINMRKTIDKRIENIMMKGLVVTGPLFISLAVTKSSKILWNLPKDIIWACVLGKGMLVIVRQGHG